MRYSDKENVNQLTYLLVQYGIEDVVSCPGSRNAPLIHNFHSHPQLRCHAVTDERSAGFYALGMALSTNKPVAICVTSGSALLNVIPSVAEAYYRNVSLVIISADRPRAWIGQYDGQTLPQQEVLKPFVALSVDLPEPTNDVERWHCNRLINEALIATSHSGGCPVHINVPITEPLYQFTTPSLTPQRHITVYQQSHQQVEIPALFASSFCQANCPVVVIGQMPANKLDVSLLQKVAQKVVLIYEPLAADRVDGIASPYSQDVETWIKTRQNKSDDVTKGINQEPDWILYIGQCIVSKTTKQWLRKTSNAMVWAIGSTLTSPDPTTHLTHWMQVDVNKALEVLANCPSQADKMFVKSLQSAFIQQQTNLRSCALPYSSAAVVRAFEQRLDKLSPQSYRVHYANSTAVRWGCAFAQHYIYVNRGVNGIEGSVSTAAGMSLVCPQDVYLVTGDLSFFYDSNSLWNRSLTGNLRILLLNNGGGAIFGKFDLLRQSHARESLVMAQHTTEAQGLCQSYHLNYLRVTSESQLTEQLWQHFMTTSNDRPTVLEVITDMETDIRAMEQCQQIVPIF